MLTARFEITVEGEVVPEWGPDLGTSTMDARDGRTTFLTPSIDQAALQGILARIGGAGLSLVGVRVLEDHPRP